MRYRLVILEEFPRPKVLTRLTEPRYRLLTRILDSGRNLAFFGLPPGLSEVGLASPTRHIDYPDSLFESRFLGLKSMDVRPWLGTYEVIGSPDTLAGFAGAQTDRDQMPNLRLGYPQSLLKPLLKHVFTAENCLPLTGVFTPRDHAEILYTFVSAFPQTSEFHGLPCGILYQNVLANAYTFSFHLWGIDQLDARQLVNYLINNPEAAPPPPLLPNEITLLQNYPNPFNPETIITCRLPSPSRVTLTVYDILGREVRVLLDNVAMTAGTHHIMWSGITKDGLKAASGVYFYRLISENATLTRKMLLLK